MGVTLRCMGSFVPHTSAEIEAMLGFLGLDSLDDLPALGDFVPGPEIVEALEQGLTAPE